MSKCKCGKCKDCKAAAKKKKEFEERLERQMNCWAEKDKDKKK